LKTAYLIRSGLAIPDYWHPKLELQTDFLSGQVGRYPVSMDVKANYPGELDHEGVPIVFWGKGKNAAASPVNIVLYGLGNYEVFRRTRDPRFYARFLNVLRWLQNHYVPFGNGISWAYGENLPIFGLKAPWFSSITQGFALSLIVRAVEIEGAVPWSELAHQTWAGYHWPVDKGGFCRHVADGLIFEEYPGPQLDCVFNGMCYSLIGLWEAWKSGVVPEAEESFTMGVRGLRSYLPQFDRGSWSRYSLNECLKGGLLASPYYHRANGLVAQVIGLMSDDPIFCQYGERWIESSKSFTRRVYMSMYIGINRYLNAPALLHSDKSRK
jgi:hypothetical protein